MRRAWVTCPKRSDACKINNVLNVPSSAAIDFFSLSELGVFYYFFESYAATFIFWPLLLQHLALINEFN